DESWAADGYDGALGFKYELVREQDGAIPALAALGEVSAPSGGGAAGGEDWEGSITLAWSYDLSERVSLAGNLNLATRAEGKRGDRYLEPSASLALGIGV